MLDLSLRITEIFYSLQGESRTQGLPTVFIRLTGCPLRCGYCDSEYAFHGGQRFTLAEILTQTAHYGAGYVCVTGGEPLAQPDVLPLLTALCDAGYSVSLETSGALSVAGVDARVSIVMDLKTPGSGEAGKNLYSNIALLQKKDQIKCVITDISDYHWARFKVDEYALFNQVGEVLFSPSFNQVSPQDLAEWILRDKLPVRLQIQLHKYLWGEKQGV